MVDSEFVQLVRRYRTMQKSGGNTKMIEKAIDDALAEHPFEDRPEADYSRYLDVICQIADVSRDDLIGRSRLALLSDCRTVVAYRMALDGKTASEIAKVLGRNRTSLYHYVGSAEGRINAPGWRSFTHLWNVYNRKLNEQVSQQEG